MERSYIAIDLKSFYASVECQERGLDPLTGYHAAIEETAALNEEAVEGEPERIRTEDI